MLAFSYISTGAKSVNLKMHGTLPFSPAYYIQNITSYEACSALASVVSVEMKFLFPPSNGEVYIFIIIFRICD